METVDIFTDGSALGNPGPGGAAAILRSGSREKELSEGYRLTTNNRMELRAVIMALEALKRTGLRVNIHSDSKYVVEAFNQKWVFKWEKTGFKKKKNIDLWKRFLELQKKQHLKFIWVKGHAGHRENERCDELAVFASENGPHQIDKGYEESI
jgi:ribonuclease HI